MRPRVGQGSLIISVIVVSLFVLIILPTAMYLIIRAPSSSVQFVPETRSEFVDLVSYATRDINATVFVDKNNVVTIAIVNYGTSEISVIAAFYRLAYPNGTTAILREETSISVGPNSVATHQSYEVLEYCSTSCKLVNVMLLTDKGLVITPRTYSEEFLEEFMVSQEVALVKLHTYLPLPYYDSSSVMNTLRSSGFKVGYPGTNPSIEDPRLLEIPQPGASVAGVRGVGTGAYYLFKEYVNVDISLSNAPVGNLYLGYNPRDTKKYDIMFSWNRAGSDVSLTISELNINLGSVCPNGYRVKIIGFNNSTSYIIMFSDGVKVTSPDPDPAKYSYLTSVQGVRIKYLAGSADIVRVYCRNSDTNYETSYEPYIMLTKFSADAPGPSLLVAFEDVYYGFATTRNDAYSSGKILQDYSTIPLRLVYNSSTTVITNSRYLGVILVVNYRFHDNEGNDFYGVSSDRVIFEVGLVDSEGNVLSSRSFTFKELTRYEDTYPPRAQAQSASIFIPLPRPETAEETRVYYPFIIIQDPYGGTKNLDDLDFTLLIEGLGVLLVS